MDVISDLCLYFYLILLVCISVLVSNFSSTLLFFWLRIQSYYIRALLEAENIWALIKGKEMTSEAVTHKLYLATPAQGCMRNGVPHRMRLFRDLAWQESNHLAGEKGERTSWERGIRERPSLWKLRWVAAWWRVPGWELRRTMVAESITRRSCHQMLAEVFRF